MSNSRRYNRRRFLATTAAAASALAIPAFVPARVFGANERINTGHIGLGGQGNGNLGKFINQAVALCDVDSERLAKAMKRTEGAGRKCEGYGDYRKLLERSDVDAVVISTPDHWHALPTIHACQAGKDVYCEKPLTLTILEGRRMVEAARENKRIVQTGSQQRSASNFRLACELVRNGKIGKLKQVLVGIPGPNHPGEPGPDSSPPPELDYNMWLGPAKLRPYNEKRVHYNFRFFWDYSGGQMTNWGAHHIDIGQWGLGMDNSGPTRVWGEATFHDKKWHEVTETCRLHYEYPDGVEMIVGQKQSDVPGGTTFIGSDGQIHVNRGQLSGKPEGIIEDTLGPDATRLYVSGNHHENFLDCIKSRKLPICDVEIGHRTATVCHLGNIVARTGGEEIRWDPEKEVLEGSDAAKALYHYKYRAPWSLT
jgi:predicted dehydrogenase